MQPRDCGRYLAHLVVQSSISQGFLVPQTFSILQIAKKGNKSDRNYLGETPLLEKKKKKNPHSCWIRFTLPFIVWRKEICWRKKKKKFAHKPLNYSEALAILSCVMDPQQGCCNWLKRKKLMDGRLIRVENVQSEEITLRDTLFFFPPYKYSHFLY